MKVYASEQEQLDAIRAWWKEQGKWILAVVIIVGLASFGWRYWQQRELQRSEQASLIYNQLLVAAQSQEAGASDLVNSLANTLIQDYSRTSYAMFAGLIQAKQAVSANQLSVAQQKLTFVSSNSKDPAIRQLAKLRLARVLLQQQNYQAALDALAKVDDSAFAAAIDDVKGDVYRAQGKNQEAQQAYQAALELMPQGEATQSLVQMKLASVK